MACVVLAPLTEKWPPFVLTLGVWGGWDTHKKKRVLECSGARLLKRQAGTSPPPLVSTCPGLCSYLSKYSLSFLEISIYKCLRGSPLFSVQALPPCPVRRPMVDTHQRQQRYSKPAEFLKNGPLPLSLSLPSSSSSSCTPPPLQHSSLRFPPGLGGVVVVVCWGGGHVEEELDRHTLAATHWRKQETDVSHVTPDQ